MSCKAKPDEKVLLFVNNFVNSKCYKCSKVLGFEFKPTRNIFTFCSIDCAETLFDYDEEKGYVLRTHLKLSADEKAGFLGIQLAKASADEVDGTATGKASEVVNASAPLETKQVEPPKRVVPNSLDVGDRRKVGPFTSTPIGSPSQIVSPPIEPIAKQVEPPGRSVLPNSLDVTTRQKLGPVTSSPIDKPSQVASAKPEAKQVEPAQPIVNSNSVDITTRQKLGPVVPAAATPKPSQVERAPVDAKQVQPSTPSVLPNSSDIIARQKLGPANSAPAPKVNPFMQPIGPRATFGIPRQVTAAASKPKPKPGRKIYDVNDDCKFHPDIKTQCKVSIISAYPGARFLVGSPNVANEPFELSALITESKNKGEIQALDDVPRVGEVLLASYQGELFRGFVSKVDLAKKEAEVEYIDFGDSGVLGFSELFIPTQQIMDAPLYGIAVQLLGADNILNKTFPNEIYDEFAKLFDMTFATGQVKYNSMVLMVREDGKYLSEIISEAIAAADQ